jgi:hypothetical protein
MRNPKAEKIPGAPQDTTAGERLPARFLHSFSFCVSNSIDTIDSTVAEMSSIVSC